MEHLDTAFMVLIGMGLARTWFNLRSAKRVLAARQEAINDAFSDRLTTLRKLENLRSNCFLTDTDGVRRRYDKVSRAVRERAEGSN